MAAEGAGKFDWSQERGAISSMDAGKDDGSSIGGDGTVGELAKVELGDPDHGPFSEFYRLALGGYTDSQLRTKQGRLEANLQNSTPADVPDGTELRVRLTDKQRDHTYAKTRWIGKSEYEASNIENLPIMQFEGFDEAEFIRQGRVVVLEWRNLQQAAAPSLADSTGQFPFIGGS